MKKQRASTKLFATLMLSGLAFFLTGLTIERFAGPVALTVLLDRGYCPNTQWQQLTNDYAQIYQQHQRKQIHIESVIFFSDLDQTLSETVPTPSTIQALKTYGSSNVQTRRDLIQTYPHAKLLSCQTSLN